tara:strand:+ start:156 stop:566 length:411 start_codon:yes stop_codon:yes gene_type:complete
MKKNIDIIKVANLGKAGASVFSKLAIDGDPSLRANKPKVEKKIEVKKPDAKAKADSTFNAEIKKIKLKDPVFAAKIDSMNAKHRADSLKVDKEFKKTMREMHVADSLRADANRQAFVQDSTNYGGIIARLKRTFGL